MKVRYDPSQFEAKLRESWEKNNVNSTRETKGEKSYILVMFPYPSGAGLHVGHVRVYTGTDVIARYLRMKGDCVLYPMGWDAFGLPAENAAIKAKKNPMDMVPQNIATFKRQMKSVGLAYDWDKEFATTDPEYYKWTQWLFIQLYKMGLLYKKDTQVYFCEFCKTGLAEEEVLPNGTHERCGNVITKKTLPQWIFKITSYGDRLLNDLEGLDWPSGILAMQKKWIGRKEGMLIKHTVKDLDLEFETFTAYPAWSFADTFIVIAPEHPLVSKLVKGTTYETEVNEFIKEAGKISPEALTEGKFEKKGVFSGRYAKDPFGGPDMPIWLANFALMDFGTGIIRCSAHDPRDYAFAQKYNIPLKEVVARINTDEPVNAHDNKGILQDSGEFSGKNVSDILEEVKVWIEKNNIGTRKVTYHLRDWIFSRQRYWGEPIPMIHCETCGWVPVPDEQLPLELPYIKSYEPTEDGSSPLSKIEEFVNTTCPQCHAKAKRETDTMPNWAGSCWYFLYFARNSNVIANEVEQSQSLKIAASSTTPRNDNHPSLENWKLEIGNSVNKWLPVDWYIGGAEHAVLHLLYSRFWVKALQDKKLLGFAEPFKRLRNVGMVLAEDHRKMSKSFGNVVNPDEVISEYGADTLRVYEMFMAPFNTDIAWSTKALQGGYRFLSRIWQIYNSFDYITNDKKNEDINLNAELQKLILKVESDITDVKFNTAIAAMMTFLNRWESKKPDETTKKLFNSSAKKFLQVLAPFAPFIADQLWQNVMKEKDSIHTSIWPTVEHVHVEEGIKKIVIQVDGKLRDILETNDINKENVVNEALKQDKISKYIEGKQYEVVYIPGRVLNFVLI